MGPVDETPLLLGIDVGTSEVKVVAVNAAGDTIRSAACAVSSTAWEPGFVEQQPEEWVEATTKAVREVMGSDGQSPLDGARVAGLALSGHMQDTILVTVGGPKGGAALRPAILYTDTRATQQADKAEAVLGAAYLQEVLGTWTGASSCLAKLLWLSEHEAPSLAEADAVLLGAHSFLCLRLCGTLAADSVCASTTGLLDIRAPPALSAPPASAVPSYTPEGTAEVGSCWATEILEKLGLASAVSKLPPLLPTTRPAGSLLPEAAMELGLPAGLPVFHAMGDVGATTLGAGCGGYGGQGRGYLYIGTSGWAATSAFSTQKALRAPFEMPDFDRAPLHFSVASCTSAGGNLEAALRRPFHSHLSKDEAYAEIERLAEQSKAGAGGVLYVAAVAGERFPVRDDLARACFLGIHSGTSKADLHRAVMEGVCHSLAILLGALPGGGGGGGGECAGGVDGALRVVGGGTRSKVMMQTLADVTGRRLEVVAHGPQVAARGAALLAAVGLGWFAPGLSKEGGSEAAAPPGWFESAEVYEPRLGEDGQVLEVHRHMLSAARGALPALRDTFRILAAARGAEALQE